MAGETRGKVPEQRGRRERRQGGVTSEAAFKQGSDRMTRFKFQKDGPGVALSPRQGGRFGLRGKEPGSGFNKPGSKPSSTSWEPCGPGQVPASTTPVSSSVKWG